MRKSRAEYAAARQAKAAQASAERAKADAERAKVGAALAAQAMAAEAWDLVHDRGVPLQQSARRLGVHLPVLFELLAAHKAVVEDRHYRELRRALLHDPPPSPQGEASWAMALHASRVARARDLRLRGLTCQAIAERVGESGHWVSSALKGLAPPAGFTPPTDEDEAGE